MSRQKWLSDENAHNISTIFASYLFWTTGYLSFYSRKTSERIKQSVANGQTNPGSIRLKRQELGVKIVSILHAAYTAHGAYNCLKENSVLDFNTNSVNGTYYANVTAGFFIADLILCTILVEEHGLEFIIHAICALSGSLFVSLSGLGQQYFLHLLLFEGSTPFLHIRALLLEYGYGKSIFAIINNLIFLITFGYFRLYKGIPVISQLIYSIVVDRPLGPVPSVFFLTAGVSMTYLNLVWFKKILLSAIKLIHFMIVSPARNA